MALIVGVHGIGQQYTGSFELRSLWFPALQDGLANAGHTERAGTLTEDVLHVSFFGDLLRPGEGAMGAGTPPYTSADVAAGPERELLEIWHDAVLAQEPELAPGDGAMGPGRVTAKVMLSRLAKSSVFTGISERLLIGNLKQVTRFLKDEEFKKLVLERLNAEIKGDTRVLIGHSLGSIVAYEYLCRYRPSSVNAFITLGSPLGIDKMIFEKLTPRPEKGVGVWPGEVKRWVNIADTDDVVALTTELAPLFDGSPAAASVEDVLVDNGNKPHAITRYLTAKATGHVLHDALS
ncbi:hypothetical protein [Streptomyces sp. NPDC058674]|uniref:hypothetical protein n=1 Tax=Streptomyces sp. NPDC058674 TaxID=3346592 RepID=UPI003663B8EF